MKVIKSQLFKQICVICLGLGILLSAVSTPLANSFNKTLPLIGNEEKLFDNTSKLSIDIGQRWAYPIKPDNIFGISYSTLGFDVLLGSRRDLVTYRGEIPKNLKDKEGCTRLPYNPRGIGDETYWGFTPDAGLELEDLEKYAGLDGSDVTSIRLYALTKSASGNIISIYTGLRYKLMQGLCHITSSIIKILIYVKNIDLPQIMQDLQLKKLVDIFTKIFIVNENGRLSIFMIFALVSFIFAITGYAINWVRGKKTNTLGNILILFLCGLTVVGMVRYNNVTDIGTSLANGVNNIMLTASSTDDPADKIWKSIPSKGEDKTKSMVVSLNQTSMINKTLIELQIMNQFGVENIEDLNEGNLISGSELGDGFGKNLGYYFWYANSCAPVVAKNCTSKNLTSKFQSSTPNNSGIIEKRLSGIITTLQKSYSSHPEEVLGMIDSLANPSAVNGEAIYLLLTIEYIALALVLVRFVLKILLSKILIAGSVLGMPIAGPMILSTRKKLVDTGKMILFLLVSYTIQLFLLSVTFDLILYTISIFIKPQIGSIFLALALTIGCLIFLPKLFSFLDNLMATANNSMGMSSVNNFKRSARMKMNSIAGSAMNHSRSKTRTKKIKQADGSIKEVDMTGSLGLGGMAAAAIAGHTGRQNTTSFQTMKNIKDAVSGSKISAQQTAVNEAKQNKEEVNELVDKMKKRREEKERAAFKNGKATFDNVNTNKLSESRLAEYNQISLQRQALVNNERLQNLNKKIQTDGYSSLSQSEQAEWGNYSKQHQELQNKSNDFVNSIQQEIDNSVQAEYGSELQQKVKTNKATAQQRISENKNNETMGEVSETIAYLDNIDKQLSSGTSIKDLDTNVSKEVVLEQKEKDGSISKREKMDLRNIRNTTNVSAESASQASQPQPQTSAKSQVRSQTVPQQQSSPTQPQQSQKNIPISPQQPGSSPQTTGKKGFKFSRKQKSTTTTGASGVSTRTDSEPSYKSKSTASDYLAQSDVEDKFTIGKKK